MPGREVQALSPPGTNKFNSDVRFDPHVLNRFSMESNSNSFDFLCSNQHKVDIKGSGVLQINSILVLSPESSGPPLVADNKNIS
jgi:hypothetical protein